MGPKQVLPCEMATSSSIDTKCEAGKDSSNETGGHALLIGSSVGAVTVILLITAVLVVMVVVCRKRHAKTKTNESSDYEASQTEMIDEHLYEEVKSLELVGYQCFQTSPIKSVRELSQPSLPQWSHKSDRAHQRSTPLSSFELTNCSAYSASNLKGERSDPRKENHYEVMF